jgi:hypothetical protein
MQMNKFVQLMWCLYTRQEPVNSEDMKNIIENVLSDVYHSNI